jgi:hypothetical protein
MAAASSSVGGPGPRMKPPAGPASQRTSYPLNNTPLPTSYPQLGITARPLSRTPRCGAMSRVSSPLDSNHQVINTVNNPVETHNGCPKWLSQDHTYLRAPSVAPPSASSSDAIGSGSAVGDATVAATETGARRGSGRRMARASGSKLSTYTQGSPQRLSTGVEIRPAASLDHGKIASPGGQIHVATVNYTVVSY